MKLRLVPLLAAVCLFAPPAVPVLSGQEAPPAASDRDGAADFAGAGGLEAVGDHDVVACVRGHVITRLEVKQEMERIRKLAPDAPEDALFWKARCLLAEQIVLLETAKVFAKELSDEEVRRYYTHLHKLDPSFVKDHFDELKEEHIIRLYMWTRLGWTYRLEGVAPDMASYQNVTPEDIRAYYRASLNEFTTKAETRIAWILFPTSAFPDPAERLAAAEECRALMQDSSARPEVLADRWPGCLPQKEKIIAGGEDPGFEEPLRAFALNAAEGEISAAIDLGAALVVARVTKKTLAEVKPFAAVQDEVERRVRKRWEDEARRFIVEDLSRRERIFWPPDLFDPRAPAPPAAPEADAALQSG